MATQALCSDHVNYLIFRYLQEAGHENAAIAFHRDWRRVPEYQDPENYPFAPVVQRHELVSIIQSGLRHDELEARVTEKRRRFQFMRTSPQEIFTKQDGAVIQNGTNGSRPGSSAKRKPRAPVMRAPDEFPTPAPKRQRKSTGSESVHLNGDRGDAMDVDAEADGDAASPSADAEEDVDPASPAVGSEPDQVETPRRYDSVHDAGVQTEPKAAIKTSTMYWKIDKPGGAAYHSMFSPQRGSNDTNVKMEVGSERSHTLLIVGESLCRFYKLPENADNATQVVSTDESGVDDNAVVTASAWHPNGAVTALAFDSARDLPDGTRIPVQRILVHDVESATSSQLLVPPLLEPAGIVLALRYNSDGRLLVLRTNLKRSLVLVYDTDASSSSRHLLAAWRIFDQPILDAAWCGPMSFVVCGEQGLRGATYELDMNVKPLPDSVQSDEVIMHGLHISSGATQSPEDVNWEKVGVEIGSNVLACASSQGRRLLLSLLQTSSDPSTYDLPGQLTAIAFRPDSAGRHDAAVVLAATFVESTCLLYYMRPGLRDSAIQCEKTVTLALNDGPALVLAWSPDGSHLAIGGDDIVQIWRFEDLTTTAHNGIPSTPDISHKPVVTWRPDRTNSEPRNSELDEEKPLPEPSLSWSADGLNLAFVVDKQIAVMRFRPPLLASSKLANGDVNGHAETASATED